MGRGYKYQYTWFNSCSKSSYKIWSKRVINFQTALCYGRPSIVPIPVNHPSNPFTSYGISKHSGEAFLLQSNLPVISFRLANICGPRLAIGPLPTFYQRLKEGKKCFCSEAVRDFLDMGDFLRIDGFSTWRKCAPMAFSMFQLGWVFRSTKYFVRYVNI